MGRDVGELEARIAVEAHLGRFEEAVVVPTDLPRVFDGVARYRPRTRARLTLVVGRLS